MPYSALPTAKEPAVPTNRRLSNITWHSSISILQQLAYSLSTTGVEVTAQVRANKHALVLSALRKKLCLHVDNHTRRQTETVNLYQTNLISTESVLSNKFPTEMTYQRSNKCIC